MTEQSDEDPAEGAGRFERIQGVALLGLATVAAVVQLLFDLAGSVWLLVGAMVCVGALRILTAPLHPKAVRWAGRKREERR